MPSERMSLETVGYRHFAFATLSIHFFQLVNMGGGGLSIVINDRVGF